MDILQSLGSLLGQELGGGAPTNQYAQNTSGQSALGGLGSLLTPEVLGGLAGALFPSNKTGGRNLGASAQGGDTGLGALGSLLSSVTGGGGSGGGLGGLGALGGLLGNLMSGGAGQAASGAHAREAMQSDSFNRHYAGQAPAPAPAQAQGRAERMLRSLIYAAKADGHIDSQEQAVIDSQLNKLNVGPEARAFIDKLIQEPLDPNKVAAGLTDPQEAIQIYALSCALTNMDNFMETSYLNGLAAALRIPDNVKSAIEAKTKR